MTATSYAEAQAGGFTIDESNAIGAKVAAAMLPVSDAVWRDVKNSVTGTLLGGVSIGSDATGRYAAFDGVDSVIDMGQSYCNGAGAVIPNWRTASSPCALFAVSFYDFDNMTDTVAVIVSEADTNTQIRVYYGGDGDGSFRMTRSGGRRILGSSSIPTQELMTTGVSIGGATDMRGYVNGVGAQSPDDPAPASTAAAFNLSVGAARLIPPRVAFSNSAAAFT